MRSSGRSAASSAHVGVVVKSRVGWAGACTAVAAAVSERPVWCDAKLARRRRSSRQRQSGPRWSARSPSCRWCSTYLTIGRAIVWAATILASWPGAVESPGFDATRLERLLPSSLTVALIAVALGLMLASTRPTAVCARSIGIVSPRPRSETPDAAEATTWRSPPFGRAIVLELYCRSAVRVVLPAGRPGRRWSAVSRISNHATQRTASPRRRYRAPHRVAGLTLGRRVVSAAAHAEIAVDDLRRRGTAVRERLRSSARSPRPAFWALRADAGNFGVVASFEFRLQSVGHCPARAHPSATRRRRECPPLPPRLRPRRSRRARRASRGSRHRRRSGRSPRICISAPAGDGRYLVLLADPGGDEQAVRPLRASRPPLLALVGLTPTWDAWAQSTRHVVHALNFGWSPPAPRAPRRRVIAVVAECSFACFAAFRTCARFHLKGPPSRRADVMSAFANRPASHAINRAECGGPARTSSSRHLLDGRFFAALDRFREGVYIHVLGGDEAPPHPRGVRRVRLRPPGRT